MVGSKRRLTLSLLAFSTPHLSLCANHKIPSLTHFLSLSLPRTLHPHNSTQHSKPKASAGAADFRKRKQARQHHTSSSSSSSKQKHTGKDSPWSLLPCLAPPLSLPCGPRQRRGRKHATTGSKQQLRSLCFHVPLNGTCSSFGRGEKWGAVGVQKSSRHDVRAGWE